MTENQEFCYREAEDRFGKMLRILKRVRNGESEAVACKAEDLCLTTFRRAVSREWKPNIGPTPNARAFDWCSWEEAFLGDLFGNNVFVYDNFHEMFQEILPKACTEQEQMVMSRIYPGQKTMREVGRELGVSGERVRQVKYNALRKLRHPRYSMPLLYGPDYVTELKKRDDAETEYARRYVKHMEDYQKMREKKLEALREETKSYERKMEQEGVDDELQWREYTRLSDIGLSVRIVNALYREHRCRTIADLCCLTENDLRHTRNLGERSVKELFAKLKELNISLREF